ncbi:MAG: hydrogenase/urease maturation nickel metallochaperone HypA [Actinomycetota bacterium]
MQGKGSSVHEHGLAKSVLAAALAEAEAHHLDSVKAIEVAYLAGRAEPESVKLHLEADLAGTPLSGAEVRMRAVSISVRCTQCDREFDSESAPPFECPDCGGSGIRVDERADLWLEALEF